MGTSASFARRMTALLIASLLAFALAPLGWAPSAWADEGGSQPASRPEAADASAVGAGIDGADGSYAEEPEGALGSGSGDAESGSSSDGPALVASALMGQPAAFVNADVALGGEPVVGSFTVDGLTYAVTGDATVELVCVSDDAAVSASDDLQQVLELPASVSCEGTACSLTSIAPYAFHLSSVEGVTLPATVASVDGRAFRASSVGSVEVASGNPTYSSYDGALYGADLTRLLLIPEGKQGSVRVSDRAEAVPSSAFSHCAGVTSVFVDADGAAFSSADDCLYDASGETLLRVPAGATGITIKDGCTSIAAGAMEGCAELESITAPASVISISSYTFSQEPETVSLPAASLADGAEEPGGAADEAQISSTVALTASDDALPEVDPSSIEVTLPEGGNAAPWEQLGFQCPACEESGSSSAASLDEGEEDDEPMAAAQSAVAYEAAISPPAAGMMEFYSLHSDNPLYYLETYGSSLRQNPFNNYKGAGWYYINHACEDGRYAAFEVAYTNERGLHVRRAVSPSHQLHAYAWTSPPPTSMSRTPTGPDLAAGDMIHDGGMLFLRYGPVIGWDPNGGIVNGAGDPYYTSCSEGETLTGPSPSRPGYGFLGWYTEPVGGERVCGAGEQTPPLSAHDDLYAHWGKTISFDVDSEPGDDDYPAIEKPDEVVGIDGGPVAIEDPKRPGYVFQGWVIPDAETNGATAIDQDLVYKDEADGKWYVDASKLPDYADEDGRVELTARWTSVISVDVPNSVTFYADVVTEGQESREGLASSAFGQSKVQSQSEVDLRIVGLESEPVKGEGTASFGAFDILKKRDGSELSGTADKLLSLYPALGQLTEDDLKDPSATSDAKPLGAVDFSLEDILLERSFLSDGFIIPAGDTLSLGYRLNLVETGTELDYDKLSTLKEGQSASIANVSYCFAEGYDSPEDWGEPLWIENPDDSEGAPRFLLLDDIKEAADDLSANGTASAYYDLYKGLLDAQVTTNGTPGAGPYFHLRVDGVYLPLQLIGICQDTKSDGSGKAGLTFQMRDIYAYGNVRSTEAGGGAFDCRMNASATTSGGWLSSAMRERLGGKKADGSASTMSPTFWGYLPARLQAAIVPVSKFQQICGGTTAAYLQGSTGETIWLPSVYEIAGCTSDSVNESEGLSANGNIPFQYMAYRGNTSISATTYFTKAYAGSSNGNEPALYYCWLRSALRHTTYSREFACAHWSVSRNPATTAFGVAPAFCL